MSKNVAILAYNKKIADEINTKLAEAPRPVNWSPEQAAFIAAMKDGHESILLEAVAGSGKTTTLLAGARIVSDDIKAGTVHSFGFAALRKYQKEIKVDSYKVSNLADAFLPEELSLYQEIIVKLVGFAKCRALGVVGSIDDDSLWFDIATHFDLFSEVIEKGKPFPEKECVAAAKELLKKSNAVLNVIDYDDMVYLPVLLGLRFWQYDVVMVDEAQDTNPARRALVRAILKKGGRVIAVGDRHQAIYGFTSADNNSLDLIAQDFGCKYMPLTVTYRCPRNVVTFASQWVSHIRPAGTAPEGSVSATKIEDFMKRNDLNGSSAVLCRVTAPLVELAFKLIRNRIACKIEGRDIGMGLKKLAQRWKIKDTAKLLEKLEEYETREKTKALAKKNEVRAQQIEDQVATLRIIIETVNSEGKHTVQDVIASIDSMFTDDVSKTKLLTLSTIHKSKGREWKNVFWYDRAKTCPSKWARQQWQKDQEINLMYVAATRAMENLIDLTA